MSRVVFLFVFLLVFTSCVFNSTSQNALKPIKVFKLAISEPSGITFLNNYLYIVSDSNGKVYKTNLKGEIINKIQISTTDNEGVTFNSEGNLVIVNEPKRKVLVVNTSGKELNNFKVGGKQKHKNSGLEGICFVPLEKSYFVVNEKSPRQLLKISLEGAVIDTVKIDFAEDLSGICFDEALNSLWIVSDKSKLLINVSLKGELIKKYKIPVNKAEGVVLVNRQIFIVSDQESKLYIFELK